MTLVKVNNRPFDQFFGEFLNDFPAPRSFGNQFPETNIHETKDAYHLELNAPGRVKEDFKISVDNGLLTVSFEKKEEPKQDNDYKTLRREFSYRSFKRSFSVDEKIDATAIQAKYDSGVLKLLLPKKEEVKQSSRQIEIA